MSYCLIFNNRHNALYSGLYHYKIGGPELGIGIHGEAINYIRMIIDSHAHVFGEVMGIIKDWSRYYSNITTVQLSI